MTLIDLQNGQSGTTWDTSAGRVLRRREKSETQKGYTRLSYNSTATNTNTDNSQRVYREVLSSFRNARDEEFEFGMESSFHRQLQIQVRRYGTLAVEAMASIILSDKADVRVIAEALRWLGDVNHSESYNLRLRLLEETLRHRSRWVRDGALLGLDAMGDHHALAYLHVAAEVEPIAELRRDMQDTIVRLSSMS